MANKMFVVIFAVLAIQGWASVEAFPTGLEKFRDELPLELMKNILYMQPEMNNEVFDANKIKGDPSKCVPYIQDAYNAATEVKRIFTDFTASQEKYTIAFSKCMLLPTLAEKQKCAQEVTSVFVKETDLLIQAWKTVQPKIVDSYNKFTKCLS